MGKQFDYFVKHHTRESFKIEEFLAIQKCSTRSTSHKEFKKFVESITGSKINSQNMKLAKLIAHQFKESSFDILESPNFDDYWTEKERVKTRSVLNSTNVALALNQASEMNRLVTDSRNIDNDNTTNNNNYNANTTSKSYRKNSNNNNRSNNSDNSTNSNNSSNSNSRNSSSNMSNTSLNSQDSSETYKASSQKSNESQSIQDVESYYYLVTNEGDYSYKLKSNSKVWRLPSKHNVSKSFFGFRDICVEKAEDLEPLNKYEELAISGIMVIDDEIGNEYYVPYEQTEELLDEISKIDYFSVGELDKDEKEICDYFAGELKKRKLEYQHVETYIEDWLKQKGKSNDLKKITALILHLLNTYCINYSIKTTNEATLVRDTVDQLLKVYFSNTSTMKCLGADNMAGCSSSRFVDMDPSLINHGKRTDYSVVTHREKHLLLSLEAKRVGRTISGDFLKLAKEMKDSLKEINKSGYKNAPVVGLLMKGSLCEVYVMDHMFDGLYRMVLVDKIYMPRDRYDMPNLKTVIAAFKKMRLIVGSSARTVNRPHPDEEDLPDNMVSIHTPIKVDRIKKLKLNEQDPNVKHARKKLFVDKQ